MAWLWEMIHYCCCTAENRQVHNRDFLLIINGWVFSLKDRRSARQKSAKRDKEKCKVMAPLHGSAYKQLIKKKIMSSSVIKADLLVSSGFGGLKLLILLVRLIIQPTLSPLLCHTARQIQNSCNILVCWPIDALIISNSPGLHLIHSNQNQVLCY